MKKSMWEREIKTDDDNAPVGYKASALDISLEELDEVQLFLLRERIDAKLPPTDLASIDLRAELVRQYQTAKALQMTVMQDEYEEPNKKATVLNAVASTLQQLIKMQSEYYTAERMKDIESHLIVTLKRLPPELIEDFFKWYEGDGVV